MYGVRKYSFSSGSIPEDSSVKNIEIISMNQSLMVSGAYGNSGNLIQISAFQPLFKTNEYFPIVQLVAHQFLALVVMVRVHLGKPNMYPQLSRIEHWTFNPRVIGSNPIGYTKYYISLVSMDQHDSLQNYQSWFESKRICQINVLVAEWQTHQSQELAGNRVGSSPTWHTNMLDQLNWQSNCLVSNRLQVQILYSAPNIWAVSSAGEHLFCKQGVVGSTPTLSTN